MITVRKVDNYYGIWDTFNCNFVDPEYLEITEEDIREYLDKHPFPERTKDSYDSYTEEDMIRDMKSNGAFIVAGTKKQAEWVAEMINNIL